MADAPPGLASALRRAPRWLWVALAALGIAAAAALGLWLARRSATKEPLVAQRPDVAACRLDPAHVYAFGGVGEDFRSAILDAADPTRPCVDRHIPRDPRRVGIRGRDGALLYFDTGHVRIAAPEAAAWSEMHKAWVYPRDTRPDAEVPTPCRGTAEGFITAPDSDRLVTWCRGSDAFLDSKGPKLALDAARGERPFALGYRGLTLGRRDRGKPALVVLDAQGERHEVKGVDIRFGGADIPVRAVPDGFLVLLPRALSPDQELWKLDARGAAKLFARFEARPELQQDASEAVIGTDGSVVVLTRKRGGPEVVVRLRPGKDSAEVVYAPNGHDAPAARKDGQPTAAPKLASSKLFTAP